MSQHVFDYLSSKFEFVSNINPCLAKLLDVHYYGIYHCQCTLLLSIHVVIHASMPKKLPPRQVVDHKIKLVPSVTPLSQAHSPHIVCPQRNWASWENNWLNWLMLTCKPIFKKLKKECQECMDFFSSSIKPHKVD
jgi:hypothetical protein